MPRRKPRSAKRTSSSLSDRIDLMLVDDHPMWRATLKNLLVLAKVGTVLAEATDGQEALELAESISPDLVIMDINLPTMDGIEATRHLVTDHPDVKVLVLASSDDRNQVLDAVRAGASGYLVKTAAPEDVVDAVRRIHNGEMVFPPSLASIVLAELRHATKQETSLRVVVADEEVLPREGLMRLLTEASLEVLGGTGDADDLLRRISKDRPNVAIIDAALALSDHENVSLAEHIRSQYQETSLLVLSADPVAAQAVSLLSEAGGGIGYLLKKRISDIGELADAVRRVARGEPVVDPQVVSSLVDHPMKAEALNALTDREQEVLALMAEGHSNQAIADRLFLGTKTVETHVARIFTKLGLEPAGDVHRRVLAVLAYLRST